MSEAGHNAAACLIHNGNLLNFAEEERFTRVKSAPDTYPFQASAFCLREQGISLSDVSCIAIGWNLDKYNGNMQRFYRSISRKYAKDDVTKLTERMLFDRFNKDRVIHRIREGFRRVGYSQKFPPLYFVDHHLAHAASTFFSSGFERATILTLDGAGEEIATAFFEGDGLDIRIKESFPLPHSLGWFYSMVTEFLGFLPNQHEGIVMGLAAFGQEDAKARDVLTRVLSLNKKGYQVDPAYIFFGDHTYGTRFTDRLVTELGPPRNRNEPITDHYKNVAYIAQDLLEKAALHLLEIHSPDDMIDNLCLAGGVAMNCSLNGFIARSGRVRNLFIQPASQDSGTALGAAMIASKEAGYDPRFKMVHAFWGPGFSNEQIERALRTAKVQHARVADPASVAAQYLAEGKIIGWFQGCMEIGARALGARSILANPASIETKDIVNKRIKFRESWRPFAPTLTDTFASILFDGFSDSLFMMQAFEVQNAAKHLIPAAVHVDGTARPQILPNTAPYTRYRQMIENFTRITSVPAILNTSFNVKGEPIVCTPKDAIASFYSTGLDALIMEDYLIVK